MKSYRAEWSWQKADTSSCRKRLDLPVHSVLILAPLISALPALTSCSGLKQDGLCAPSVSVNRVDLHSLPLLHWTSCDTKQLLLGPYTVIHITWSLIWNLKCISHRIKTQCHVLMRGKKGHKGQRSLHISVLHECAVITNHHHVAFPFLLLLILALTGLGPQLHYVFWTNEELQCAWNWFLHTAA